MKYTIHAACASHVGKRRLNNEDNFVFNGACLGEGDNGTSATLVMEKSVVDGVHIAGFDGIGGESYGEAASYAAAQKLIKCSCKNKPFYISDVRFIEDLMSSLNAAVLDKGCELISERLGTTCAAIYAGLRSIHVVNLGDSRVYLLQDGSLIQLSVDDVSDRPLTGRRKAPITQHLGMNPLEVKMVPHIKKKEPHIGDRYLLCSDGLTDMVSDEEITAILMENSYPERAVDMLIDRALENGGRDNVTVIVCDIC